MAFFGVASPFAGAAMTVSTSQQSKVKTKKPIKAVSTKATVKKNSVVPPAPPEEAPSTIVEDLIVAEKYIEETQKNVSQRVLRLADSIDSFFGDKRSDDQKNTSTFRISQRYFHKDGVTGGEDISATLNLHLPNLEKMEEDFKEKFRSKTKSEDGTDTVEDEIPEEEKEVSPWSLNQESGIVVANPLNYFARLRLRRDFVTDLFVHSFYEQVGWSKANEWEEETSLNSDYAISRDLLFRFSNIKYWAMTNHNFSTSHGPSILQKLTDIAAISYDFRVNTVVENDALYGDSMRLSSLYRTQLPIGWIYLDLNPEIAWERATNFRVQYNFYLRLELVFGHVKN